MNGVLQLNSQQTNSKTVMISPARRIAYAGLITALSVALLYLLRVLPTLRLAMLFVLSLLPAIPAHERRYADAVLSFAASVLLSALLVPMSGPWLLYACFFGWYGVVRELVVTRWSRIISWIVLAGLFNAAFFAVYFAFQSALTELAPPAWLSAVPLPLLLIPAAELAFVLFELLFGMCRAYYIQHVRKLIYPRT